MSSNNLRFECKHAIYTLSLRGKSDIIFVKENVIDENGNSKPHTRIIKDMKRDYYLTKPAYRNHQDKKDYEELSKLQKFSCPQWDLPNHISKMLGKGATDQQLRRVCRSPYVYGADIEPSSIVKAMYEAKFPDTFTPYKISVFDIETEMVDERYKGEPIMASLTFKERTFTFVIRRYFGGEADERIHQKLKLAWDKYLGDWATKRSITNPEFVLVDSAADGFVKLFERAHEWMPDFITGWNVLEFDYKVLTQTLTNAGINPADVICDPSVPQEYRNVYYYEGKTHKVKNDGKEVTKTSLANYEKWPYVNAPASFRWAESMSAYYYLRTMNGKELNYKLDNIAEKILGVTKMKFSEAEGYHGADWHEFMQSNYKYEYVMYNIFDCIVVEMMDEKTSDLSVAVPTFCGVSDYRNFISQPTRIAEAMHYDVMKEGYIWGTTSDQMRTELDDHIQGLGGWIVMLPTELVALNGKAMFKELPNVKSYVRTGTNDIDVEGAYPTGTVIMNVGKQTTWIEMTQIEGLDDTEYRQVAVNLAAGGMNNAGELARKLYKAPETITLLKDFMVEKHIEIDFMAAA
ncbi:putative DNA polymerase [Erwinia phage Rebecca]|uniref:Putative DNA polymerase n=2 Tax=Agricanvirus ray TaxID=1984779 RepID=A0A482IGB8_9CAUD|nr:putative DNA polymerase [Erwinia phage vB_EamM_Mortimer]QBP07392.1 putative DNA polymerase [Erwinia phage Rebecca]